MLAMKDVPLKKPATTYIRQYRLAFDYTQRLLAEKMGIPKSVTNIADAENSNYVKPGLRRKYSELFNVPEDVLFDADGFAREIT